MEKKDTNTNRKVKKTGEQRRQLRQVGNKEEKIEKRKKEGWPAAQGAG